MIQRPLRLVRVVVALVVLVSVGSRGRVAAGVVASVESLSEGGRDASIARAANARPSAPRKRVRRAEEEENVVVYRVGVLAIRGFPAAYEEFNATFSEYLTATAGARLSDRGDRAVRFELKPLNFRLLFTDVASRVVDLIYVNPSAYSCIESEYGAYSLTSQISLRRVSGAEFRLTQFGGVVFARANDDRVSTVTDLKDKTIAAASISGLGSGQMQFRLLQNKGLSYVHDPLRLVFTSNQGKVVRGVLDGTFDVGFVRTDQIERTKHLNGTLVDASLLKVIEPTPDPLQDDGTPFPFASSTRLYPEWNLASLTHVPNDVSVEVQRAMLDLADHADAGEQLAKCYESCVNIMDTNATNQTDCVRACDAAVVIRDAVEVGPDGVVLGTTFVTTPSLALLAHRARSRGKYAGWRSTLSYMELRNMQEETGFLVRNDDGPPACVRASRLHDAVVCPPGHFKKSVEEMENGCDADAVGRVGCPEGMQCLCRPCQRAFDVDVFAVRDDGEEPVDAANEVLRGCGKMAICGTVEQGNTLVLRAIDNRKRRGANMTVVFHEGEDIENLTAQLVVNATSSFSFSFNHTYEFPVSSPQVGVVILEILVNDEQIPESPLRVEIVPRDCVRDTDNDPLRVPDADGVCVCRSGSTEIMPGRRCVSLTILLPAVLAPAAVLAAIALWSYTERKRRHADSVWSVKTSELTFAEPHPEIVGRGTFGLVLLAEYRGTDVAVKRVIPPRVGGKHNKRELRTRLFGKGDGARSNKSKHNSKRVSEAAKRAFAGEGPVVHGRRASDDMMTGNNSGDTYTSTESRRDSEASWMSWGEGSRRSSNVAGGESDDDVAVEAGLRSGQMTGLRSCDDGLTSGNNSGVRSTSWRKKGFNLTQAFGYRDEYARLKADFIVEMRHLSKLRHPCVTTVMGAVIAKNEEPMLVMEYMDHGSLYDLLHNDTMIIEGELLLPILRDIAQGVRFLHAAQPQVIHGDLKAQNVLVDSKFRAKVADFGLSQKKQVGATGTPYWMAPELLRRESENTAASDVYSFGIILYEVYSRKDPYEGEDYKEVIQLVADSNVNKRPIVPDSCPPQIRVLMGDCLVGDPDHRPTFEELDQRLKRLDVETVEPGEMHLSMQVKKEQNARRTNELLFEVFPQHIAEALRDGRKVEPESREIVTIFFSDIVGFTNISATLPPIKISDMLDRLYNKFDNLSVRHDIFKVETIGDAYMAVTNLVKDQPDHAKRVAEFSVDALEAANQTLIDEDDPEQGVVNIRVGFHSGPVVANVVGSRNPRYCLFGDTVNTASRMESNSQENRIHCSSRAAKLVKKQHPEMPIRSRGKITVKGKGEMRTFWINEEPSSRRDLNSLGHQSSASSMDSSSTAASGPLPSDEDKSKKELSGSRRLSSHQQELEIVREDAEEDERVA